VRQAYGETLVELGREREDIIVLDADLSHSTHTNIFAQEFPERFFNCGIAEQNMMGIASGLASCGKTVFVSSFAVFATCRCFDQLRMCIAEPGANVKVVATHAGISVGEDGFSHHSIEDLSLALSLPHFKVIVPTDATETREAIRLAAENDGPFYIRLPRPRVPQVLPEGYHFSLGKAYTLREGRNATIIACGLMVTKAIEAAARLEKEGVSCRVLGMPTLRPLDEEAIVKAARETGGIVTAEEHLEHGGLGSVVAQVVAKHHPVPVSFVAIKNTYAKSGKANELLKRCGLTSFDIEREVKSVIGMERGG
jgi:transketolase